MTWFRSADASAAAPSDAGVLIVNLGTPAAPTYGAIRRFLADFLSDRRVIEACPAYWYPLLYCMVLTIRPLKIRHAYASIWTEDGSPLLAHSKRLAIKLQAALGDPARIRVELAMTYGTPSIAAAIERLQQARVRRLIVLPLYPQYSATTSGAIFDRVTSELSRWRCVPALRFVSDYHAEPEYIEALSAGVLASWAEHGRSHLVISNHGIPVKYAEAGDPYPAQVAATARALAKSLELADDEYSATFQSRFGPTTWLMPYTDERLTELAESGVTDVTVVTPSFSADCLETLDEIGVGSRRVFLAAGGRGFHRVPALNDSPSHVAALTAILSRVGL